MKQVVFLIPVVFLLSCTQEIGFYYQINNESNYSLTNIELYKNEFIDETGTNKGYCFFRKDSIGPHVDLNKGYYKIGMNAPFGVLPAHTFCIFSAIRNEEKISAFGKLETIDNSSMILFIITDTEIKVEINP